ncbi:VOC family protein [Aestuariibacter halophilus]|uniref:VOC family protein n=1 Tax=Fluctibacter halophilus TaxID=226011 RepID=A0ABS8G256_9ALTE|nr:VOC family protein [Aestuariibacter halophilus]MCC2614660.1 VOC family protein [Aestuariibacter halophilus]
MELGQFSVSLKVADIAASQRFYTALGFETEQGCGSIEDKWLIMRRGETIIGLFQDMLDSNLLTFNPGDARAVQAHLQQQGYTIDTPIDPQNSEGPAHFFVKDPDGNTLMFDQW